MCFLFCILALCYSFTTGPQNGRTKQSWTEISTNVSPNQSFFFFSLSCLSQAFVLVMETWLTLWLNKSQWCMSHSLWGCLAHKACGLSGVAHARTDALTSRTVGQVCLFALCFGGRGCCCVNTALAAFLGQTTWQGHHCLGDCSSALEIHKLDSLN